MCIEYKNFVRVNMCVCVHLWTNVNSIVCRVQVVHNVVTTHAHNVVNNNVCTCEQSGQVFTMCVTMCEQLVTFVHTCTWVVTMCERGEVVNILSISDVFSAYVLWSVRVLRSVRDTLFCVWNAVCRWHVSAIRCSCLPARRLKCVL